jgi:hypothetical protein
LFFFESELIRVPTKPLRLSLSPLVRNECLAGLPGEGQLKKRNQIRDEIRINETGPAAFVVLMKAAARKIRAANVTAQRAAPTVSLRQPTSNVSTYPTATSVMPTFQLVNR